MSRQRDAARTQEVLRRVRRLELSTKRLVDSVLAGQYHTRFKGHGMQFADLREYYLGDDIRHIDWKVTARTQVVHIKKFEEERELCVYFVADLSRSGVFGSQAKNKMDALAEVCALLVFAATRNNDRVGLILFTDHVERHVPPKKGKAHALRVVTDLLYHDPESDGTNLEVALQSCRQAMKTRGVVFVASDFIDGDARYFDALRQLARRHDVIGLQMKDPVEADTSALKSLGLVECVDAETGERWVSGGDAPKTTPDKEVAALFRRAGAALIELSPRSNYMEDVFRELQKGTKR